MKSEHESETYFELIQEVLGKNKNKDFYLRYQREAIDRGLGYVQIFENLTDISLKNKKVLVIGAAGGGEVIAYAKKGARSYALDISSQALQGIKIRVQEHKIEVPIIQADAMALPFCFSKFDLVFMMDVIEHIQRPYEAISEAVRVLKVGGHLVLNSVNKYSFYSFGPDPHYKLLGIMFLPYIIASLYVTRIRKVSPTYDVVSFPTRTWLGRVFKANSLSFINATEVYKIKKAIGKINFPQEIKNKKKTAIRNIFMQLKARKVLIILINIWYKLESFFSQSQLIIAKKE